MKDQRVSEGCTPTPWRVLGVEVVNQHGQTIVRPDSYFDVKTQQANAKMICLAVNEHQHLINTLENVTKHLEVALMYLTKDDFQVKCVEACLIAHHVVERIEGGGK